MKSYKVLLPVLAIAVFGACSDDDDGETVTDLGPCPNGEEFCMDYEGESYAGTAEITELEENIFRITFSGDPTQELEIDVYGSAVGTYQVDTTETPGSAAVEYFSANTGGNLIGISGSVEVTAYAYEADEIQANGTFDVLLEDSTRITNGHFSVGDLDHPDEDGGG